MSLSITSAILILGIFQIFFILKSLSQVSVIGKHQRGELHIFLILLILFLLDGIFLREGIYLLIPSLFAIFWPFMFFVTPILYIYILRNSYPKVEIDIYTTIRHLSFPAVISLSFLPFFIFYNDTQKIAILNSCGSIDLYTQYITETLFFINILEHFIYLTLIFRRINLHEKYIKENFSNIEDYSFVWMQKMILGLFIVILLLLIDIIFALNYLNDIPIAIWVLIFNWQLLTHSKDRLLPNQPPKTTQIDSISIDELKDISIKLEEIVERDKLYLNLSLSLDDVSKAIGVNRQKLSSVLNQYMHISFYDYINQKRVTKAKKLLLDTKYDGNFMMLSLDCGFRSRSVFYTAFKKYTSMTPTEYKKSKIG